MENLCKTKTKTVSLALKCKSKCSVVQTRHELCFCIQNPFYLLITCISPCYRIHSIFKWKHTMKTAVHLKQRKCEMHFPPDSAIKSGYSVSKIIWFACLYAKFESPGENHKRKYDMLLTNMEQCILISDRDSLYYRVLVNSCSSLFLITEIQQNFWIAWLLSLGAETEDN